MKEKKSTFAKDTEDKKEEKDLTNNNSKKETEKEGLEMKKKKKNIILVVALSVFGVALIGLLVWLLFFKQPSFTGENFSFNIDGPSEVVAGELVTYKIEYQNNENVDLNNVEMGIIYPDGFVFKSAEPKSLSFNDNKWSLDTIKAGEGGSIIIKGDLYGDVGTSLTCVANITYKPKNVSSNFNQNSEVSTKITPSDIDLMVDMPATTQLDKEFEYTIQAKNSTDFDINNVRIESIMPDNFELISAVPNYKSSFYWDFPNIAAGKSEEIKIRGKLSGEVGDSGEFKVRYGLFDGHNNFYLQEEDIYSIKLVDVSGDLKVLVNGVEDSNKNPGDALEYTLYYKNTGSEPLVNNELSLQFENSELFDQESIITDQGEFKDSKVIWSHGSIEKLKKIEPGQEGTFVFKINIINPIVVDNIEDNNFSIKAKPEHIAKRGESNEEVSIEGNEVETKINTEIILSSEARYYDFDGKKIGSGPLPPKVGEKTTYRIYLTLANRTNDADNGRVEIKLSGITKLGAEKISSVGDIKYEGGLLTWEIGKIPANTGQFANSMTAEFEVVIEPSEGDVGKTASIIDELIFTGSDSFTNNKIELIKEGLDTSLPKDVLSQGKGEVSN